MLIPKIAIRQVRKTELSSRKRAILSAIIKSYIESGEPVGSKILTELIANAPSSATLRNEMNELCSLGLLSQPHISAGRIPTSLGLKFYVDSLMQPTDLPQSTKHYIASSLSPATARKQNLPENAANTLSDLTGYCAFSYYKVDSDVFAKDIEILPVSEKTLVLLFVTSDGRAGSRICSLKSPITADFTERISRLISAKFKRKPLSVFTRAYLQSVITSSGTDCFEFIPLITEIFDMAQSSLKSQFTLSGDMKLYNICRPDEVRRILELANDADAFISVLQRFDDKDSVIFGSETGIKELCGKVIVVSEYSQNGKYSGKIGIIGDDRMSYDQIIPSLEYTANALSERLSRAQKDMEE